MRFPRSGSIGRLISSELKEGSATTLRTHQTYNAYNQLKKQCWQMDSVAENWAGKISWSFGENAAKLQLPERHEVVAGCVL